MAASATNVAGTTAIGRTCPGAWTLSRSGGVRHAAAAHRAVMGQGPPYGGQPPWHTEPYPGTGDQPGQHSAAHGNDRPYSVH
jgi:hypothetical protein